MKEIKLTQGKVALVDDEDYEELNKYKWCADKGRRTYYAVRSLWANGRKSGKLYMHRVIMKAQPGEQVDHKSSDGLDCQKKNMRICTPGENNMNQRKQTRKCHSKFKGVCLDDRENRNKTWFSYININKKRTYLGCYNSEIDAARAYNNAAINLFGDFARLNFI